MEHSLKKYCPTNSLDGTEDSNVWKPYTWKIQTPDLKKFKEYLNQLILLMFFH